MQKWFIILVTGLNLLSICAYFLIRVDSNNFTKGQVEVLGHHGKKWVYTKRLKVIWIAYSLSVLLLIIFSYLFIINYEAIL